MKAKLSSRTYRFR